MFSRFPGSIRRDTPLQALNDIIEDLSESENTCGVLPARVALGSARVLLTTIRETMENERDYIDLGFSCADVCHALEWGLRNIESGRLSQSVVDAIDRLNANMADIERRILKRKGLNVLSRATYAKGDKDAIKAWKLEFGKIRLIFQTELPINAIAGAMDIHRDSSVTKESFINKQSLVRPSIPLGELPPPIFGRDTLIEKVVALAENFESIALIGAGGIGKTSIALAVLRHHRIKFKFGDDRRFLRCDTFTPSLSNFLAQLSEVIGAGIQNPDNFDSLRPFLSSKKMVLFLNNTESILDPGGADFPEIYTVVEELGRFDNISLGITSRISIVPPHCRCPVIPKLSVESACQIFYSIYHNGAESDIVRDLVRRLDFHALSITLIATSAFYNAWDYNQLLEEWNTQRSQVLRTDYNQNLATTIEFSLTSPTFRKLGPSARELLGVIAFFPQGVDRNNLGWLFPTMPDIESVFNKFCALSLTYQSGNFFTMLAPIRDYLIPKDPTSSPLLCKTRDQYITRLLVRVHPDEPGLGFEEAGWIVSEDLNVEHLLDTFTSLDAGPGDVWDACGNFMEHLYWHKPRKTVLRVKIEALPDDHPSKPKGLFELSRLYSTTIASPGGGTFSDLSSATDRRTMSDPTPPFVVTDALSKRYYKGLPSKPPLIATTKPNPFEEPTGPEAYAILKELKELGDHPLASVWDGGLADRLRLCLNKMHVNWTSIEALRIVEVGESSGPAIIWIGVEFGALSFEEGSVVASTCHTLIDNYGIRDCYVEIRESRVMRQVGNRFLDPIPFPDPTFTARDPYTATLGIPISTKDRPWTEGTGGFYLSAGSDDKNIYLVTARHVVLPLDQDDNKTYERKNSSMAREDVVVLGTSGFSENLAAIDYRIRGKQSVITDAKEMIELVEGVDDPESVTRRQKAERDLEEAEDGLKKLEVLRHEIATHWKTEENRVFGELAWAPPIAFSTEPGQYTQDLAVIKIDAGKLDTKNYRGNTINIGDKYTRQEFMDKVYLHPTSPNSFTFPVSRLVTLRDQVPESALVKLPMLDSNGYPCLVVFKNGAKTGTTIGKANNVPSYTRRSFAGQYQESREWSIIPTNKDSGAFSAKGDSGSCVADAFKRFGGILIGGTGATESSDVTYVTPISFVMKVLHNSKRFKHAHLNPDLA